MKRSAKEFAADDEVPDGTATKRQSIEKQRDFFKKHFCNHQCSSQFIKQLQSNELEVKRSIKVPALKNFMSYAIWRGQKEISFIDEDRLQLTGCVQSRLLKNFEKVKTSSSDALDDELYQVIGLLV
uniref:Uncharacterized protein n=1 Tax=Ditylenchus dipsaci TaxID=166011 RepID=A0A915CM59_9BILA